MLKSKQRMDFNMTSNIREIYPLKKRTRSLLKPQNPSLPRLRRLLRPKKQTPSLLQNPIAAGPIWTISGKHKTVTINTRAVDMPVNCQKKSGKNNPPRWRLPGIAVILLTIAAGCVPSVGLQGSIFVLLPYAVQLAAACSLAWACARLLGKEYPLREYV